MNPTAILPNWCRLALLVVALAVVALLLTRCSLGRAEYHRRIAALRAAGEPITATDFAARYPDPPPERDFRRLLRLALPAGSDPAAAPPLGDVWTAFAKVRAQSNREPLYPDLLDQVRCELLASAATVELLLRTDLADFGLLHEWQDNGGFAYSGYRDGERVSMRINLCLALALQAAYEAEVGHPQHAATALVRGFQIAHLPSHAPQLSRVEVFGDCEAIMLTAVKRMLNRAKLTDDDLRYLGEALHRPSDFLRESVLSQRVSQLSLWDDPVWACYVHPLGFPKWYDVRFNVYKMGCRLRGYDGRLQLLDRWADRVAATRLPMREQLAAIATIESKESQFKASQTNFASRVRKCWDVDYSLFLESYLDLANLFNVNAVELARLANAQAAVAIERWRLEHPGRLPDTLAELVPAYLNAVPLDPFDGQPVRYKKLPVGYVVYCLGLDFTDNGGREGEQFRQPGFDTTLIVEW
jgi:hypothetical protein